MLNYALRSGCNVSHFSFGYYYDSINPTSQEPMRWNAMFEKTNNYALPVGCNGSHFSYSYYYVSAMSIIDPLACEFAKIFCYNTFTNKSTLKKDPSENLTCYKSRLVHHQYNTFLSTFSLCSRSVIYDHFKESFRNIVGNNQTLVKKHPLKKRHVMDTFSLGNSVGLKDRQSKHTIFNCKCCLENGKWKDALAMLPMRGFLHQAKAKKPG